LKAKLKSSLKNYIFTELETVPFNTGLDWDQPALPYRAAGDVGGVGVVDSLLELGFATYTYSRSQNT